jgi:hypothetical protein
MPQQIIEYRCLLISPGDVAEEREALTKVVMDWNAHVGRGIGARLELVRWESHSVPEMGGPPQSILNSQIVDSCDLAIAIFWARLGTPTQEFPSGSVEEIARLVDKGARVLVYFSDRPISPSKIDLEQLHKREEIRKRYQNEGLLATFDDVGNLCRQVNLHLTSIVTQLVTKDNGNNSLIPSSGILTAPTPDIRVQVDAGYAQSEIDPNPKFFLSISVQNHSTVSVFINSLYLETSKESGIVVPNGDYLSGRYQSKHELLPGRSTSVSIDPNEIREYYDENTLVFAAARDEIGRVYRSTKENLRTALKILFEHYLKDH